jgi:hypothetical protein
MTSSDLAGTEEFGREGFWRQQFPDLNIGGDSPRENPPDFQATDDAKRLWFERMREEGYVHATTRHLGSLAARLAGAVEHCKRLSIPPVCIFLFNETWESFYSLDSFLRAFLGDGYRILPDFWAWYLDPLRAESGWSPHRDKGRLSLRHDGMPDSLTVWIPLTESTPENGCIYVLPANRDPVYGTERGDTESRVDISKARALPAKPGDFLSWNQAVLHWGGEASRFASHARIAMALEFQSGEREPFNQPLLTPFVNLDFGSRLKLVAKQILQYRHMYPLTERIEALAKQALAV